MACCEMKGFLTFLVLWIISKGPANGAEISKEIEKRRGCRPSPGTIYPVLKDLKNKKLIQLKKGKYHITKPGKEELCNACSVFAQIFYDMKEICRSCK